MSSRVADSFRSKWPPNLSTVIYLLLFENMPQLTLFVLSYSPPTLSIQSHLIAQQHLLTLSNHPNPFLPSPLIILTLCSSSHLHPSPPLLSSNLLIISSPLIYSWGRERYMVETKLTHGMQSFGSMRGVSGHQHNPFAGIFIHWFYLFSAWVRAKQSESMCFPPLQIFP